jgi:hypothetical protein
MRATATPRRRSISGYRLLGVFGARPQVINAKFPLKNFKVEMIAENVALVTYISEVTYEKVEVGNRSSIWIKTPNGWQLRFHQGTPVEDK